MNLIISNSSGKPIYEQITDQIKTSILSGELQEGQALPSMRALARDLRISVITTKRAYEDLERDGFVVTVAGKGCFVAPRNLELMREEHRKKVEEALTKAIEQAKAASIDLPELDDLTGEQSLQKLFAVCITKCQLLAAKGQHHGADRRERRGQIDHYAPDSGALQAG